MTMINVTCIGAFVFVCQPPDTKTCGGPFEEAGEDLLLAAA